MGAYEYISESADTDTDGLNDGEEVNTHGSNPTLTDSDDDGRTDGDEVAMGWHPVFDEASVIADTEARVTGDPASYDLYTSNSITDLDMGLLMLQASNTTMRMSLQLEQCTNLTDNVWTNAGDAVLWQLPATNGEAFFRVRGAQ